MMDYFSDYGVLYAVRDKKINKDYDYFEIV